MNTSGSRRFRPVTAGLLLAFVCAVSSGDTPTYTLVVGPSVSLPMSSGTNLFAPFNAVAGDLNGDGAPDIVVGMNQTRPVVYFNNGTIDPFQGTFGNWVGPPLNVMSGTSLGKATLADVNADGRLDIAIAGFHGPSYIYLNDGTATPFNNTTPVTVGAADEGAGIAFGEINGDGFVDMAIANTNSVPSRVYLTQGAPLTSGTYVTRTVGSEVGFARALSLADLDGDGKLDLVLSYQNLNGGPAGQARGVAIYQNEGAANPYPNVWHRLLPDEIFINAFVVADFTGDGKKDLVVSTTDAEDKRQQILEFVNNGDPTQYFSVDHALVTNVRHLGCNWLDASDVDGDGKADLLASCKGVERSTSPNPATWAAGSIFLNTGSSTAPFQGVVPRDIPYDPDSVDTRSVVVANLVAGRGPYLVLMDAPGRYAPMLLAQDPVATPDSARVGYGVATTIVVLANDVPAQGQALDPASVSVVTAPMHGTTSVNPSNGVVTYQPAAAYVGTDRFEYTTRDGLGALSRKGVVDVRVQAAPVVRNDLKTLSAGRSVTLDVLANDTSDEGTINVASLAIVVPPLHGMAVVTQGKVAYTPATGYAGVDAFQYSVQDDLRAVSNLATVSLSVQAIPSAANDTASTSANQNVTINVLANDKSEGGTLSAASLQIVAAPSHGTATVTSGQITYVPAAGYSGQDSLQYSVQDDLGEPSNVATVSIDVAAPGGTGGTGNTGGIGNTGGGGPVATGGSGGGGGAIDLLDLLLLVGAVPLVVRRRWCTRERIASERSGSPGLSTETPP